MSAADSPTTLRLSPRSRGIVIGSEDHSHDVVMDEMEAVLELQVQSSFLKNRRGPPKGVRDRAARLSIYERQRTETMEGAAQAIQSWFRVTAKAAAAARARPRAYVINGFYMSMREKYTRPGASIHYMQVT